MAHGNGKEKTFGSWAISSDLVKRVEKLKAALRGVIAIADRDCPEFRFARKALNAE